MARIGLICPEMSGHLNPTCALGRELSFRGHEVVFFGMRDGEDHARNAGLGYCPIGEVEFPKGEWKRSTEKLGKLHGLAAFRYTIGRYRKSAEVVLRDLPAALLDNPMDGLIVDQTSTPGAAVADHLELPFVSLACALMMNSEPSVPPMISPWPYRDSWVARLRNRIGDYLFQRAIRTVPRLVNRHRDRWNLPRYKSRDEIFSKLAQIAQVPREFDFPRKQLPQVFHYTGPLHTPEARTPVPFPYEQLSGKPLVYASLGTLQNRLGHVFQTIVDSCRDLDVQLVLSIGGGHAGLLNDVPASTIVVEFAPQLDLLKRASLAITHAGMNTTMEALSEGVPLVCLPVTNDQPAIASRVAWTKTGLVVPLKKLTAIELRNAVSRVLKQGAFHDNAQKMQAAIRDAGGLPRAAEIVESALLTGQPVLNFQFNGSRGELLTASS